MVQEKVLNITLKNHGKNTELGVGTIKAILRRFDIDRSEFLNA